MWPFGALFNLICPPICVVCQGVPAPWDPYLCPECLAEIWRKAERYGRCEEVPFVSWMGWLGSYEGPIRAAIHEMKFGGRKGLARHLGWLLGRRLPPSVPRPRLLVPIPSWRGTERKRGFNQALEIARGLGAEWGVPVRADVLRKVRPTRPQRSLSLVERGTNVRDSFALNAPLAVRGHRVGLVDDVFTTGATLTAAARLLHAAGARELVVFVVGRTPRDCSPAR
ncbi:MAG: ComF family protein [Candidatus Riflebacteria bacterium]|nr:ComF family protein [Candidatus Riflebacteria bacterium]